MKILSLAIVSGAALILLLGGGVFTETSDGATTYVIDSNPGTTWANYGTNISLFDGDTLTIAATAGSPGSATNILIDANANVTINGNGNTITNLWIMESGLDTATHNVNINNLKISGPAANPCYSQQKGVLRLTGTNVMTSTGNSAAINGNTVTIAGSGTLTANGGSYEGIGADVLDIQGTARVTATATGAAGMGVWAKTIKVASGASLTCTSSIHCGIYVNVGNPLNITCNGTITTSGFFGIENASGAINIAGSGTINATGGGTGCGLYSTSAIAVNGTKVNATSGGNAVASADGIVLTNGAHLSATGVNGFDDAPNKGITMSPGTTVTFSNSATKTNIFKMSAAGNQWELSGGATFAAPSTATSNPANITVPAGTPGTIKLVPPSTPPGINGQTTMTLTEGYAATSTTAYTLTGTPAPTVNKTSGDPKITWSGGKLNIATGLAAGSYPVVLTASNGTPPNATLTFTLTVNPAGGGTTPTVTAVKVAPATADVQKGSTRTFSATVEGTNSPSQAVAWTMTGNSDANTKISTAGVLTVAAGETASTLTVKATSNADTTKFGTATVTVKAASGGTDGKDGTDDSGGSDNTLMYVAVGAVVLIAIVGVAYFVFIRKP